MRTQQVKRGHDSRRAKEQSWRARGYTQLPNILLSRALPVGVRATAAAIYARGFGQRQGVCLATETLARDVGVSRQTIQKHLNILEAAGLIRRIRRGQGLANVIVLTLKDKSAQLGESIRLTVCHVSDVLLGCEKKTMDWWAERWKVHKQAMRVSLGKV